MKNLVRYLLRNASAIPLQDWTAQGFGFLRLRVDSCTRLHVWDSRLRAPGVSDIHDHTQWAFTSHIVSGALVNIRYGIDDTGQPHHMANISCGIGGGMQPGSLKTVGLVPGKPELYLPGDSYRQQPDEIHRTMPTDGTVTLIIEERHAVETARVFWPQGGSWGDAIPRQATKSEVDEVVTFALSIFGDSGAVLQAAA